MGRWNRIWGEYKNDTREGFGLYKWKDGIIFIGLFKKGKPDGKGIININEQ